MKTLGALWESLYELVAATTDEKKLAARRKLDEHSFDLSSRCSWDRLRVSRTLDVTPGFRLPDDMQGIDGIYSEDYYFVHRPTVEATLGLEACHRWAFAGHSSGQSVSTTSSLAVGATGLGGSIGVEGDFVQVGTYGGLYRLSAPSTLERPYRGPAITTQEYLVLKPDRTRLITLYDDEGDEFSGSVTIDGWMYPDALVVEWQTTYLPTIRPLLLGAAYDILFRDKRSEEAVAMSREVQRAIDDAMAANPVYACPAIPHDRYGRPAGFGARP